jgi:hypothetical protein
VDEIGVGPRQFCGLGAWSSRSLCNSIPRHDQLYSQPATPAGQPAGQRADGAGQIE